MVIFYIIIPNIYNNRFVTKIENNGRFILHFGAVDQICEVFINGKKVDIPTVFPYSLFYKGFHYQRI